MTVMDRPLGRVIDWKVKELCDELKARSLPYSGQNKDQLFSRLRKAMISVFVGSPGRLPNSSETTSRSRPDH